VRNPLMVANLVAIAVATALTVAGVLTQHQ
jgi:hypothetical protein